jgi:hypothetical protein
MNEKVVAVLLILAIVFSLVSITITMSLDTENLFFNNSGRESSGGGGNVQLVVNEGLENETE